MKKIFLLIIILTACDFSPSNVENFNQKYRYVSSWSNPGSFAESYFPINTGNSWKYKVYINPLIDYIPDEEIVWDKDSVCKFEIGEQESLNKRNWSYFVNSVHGYLIKNFKNHDSYYIKHDSSISLLKFIYGTRSDINGYVMVFDYNLKGNEFMGCKYIGDKDVNIPLGNFKTKVFENVLSGNNITVVYYFVEDIGFILNEYLDNKGNVLYRYTLIDYTIK